MLGCLQEVLRSLRCLHFKTFYCIRRYYSATIIKMSGVVSTTSAAIWLASVTAGVNFVFTFVGLYLVERIGRRPLTIASLAGIYFAGFLRLLVAVCQQLFGNLPFCV